MAIASIPLAGASAFGWPGFLILGVPTFIGVCCSAGGGQVLRGLGCGFVSLLGIFCLMCMGTGDAREAARRAQCSNNLKQIMLALHNYHDVYKSFPPAYVLGPDGKPWHSWRVLILPFMDEKTLYSKYRFDEPWDGPNNSLLLGQMPQMFRCPSDGQSPLSTTSYVVVVGDETMWPGAKALSFRDIKDGTWNTIAVVETTGGKIPWSAPVDLTFADVGVGVNGVGINLKTHSSISSHHPGGAQVGLADGSVRFISEETKVEMLDKLITVDGGEKIGEY